LLGNNNRRTFSLEVELKELLIKDRFNWLLLTLVKFWRRLTCILSSLDLSLSFIVRLNVIGILVSPSGLGFF
jgi:hypothetical protein